MVRLAFAALFTSILLLGAPAHRLVVISIDGLDARFLNEADRLHLKTPNLRKLLRTGKSATGVIGVAPSETWPSHTSLVTGVIPAEHGILANDVPGKPGVRYFSADMLRATTLWQAATKSGLRAASIYWPVTLNGNMAFCFPEYWENRHGNAIDTEPILQKSAPAGIGQRVESVFPSFSKQLWDDTSTAQAALYLLANEKPDLLLIHFAELDAEQHETTALSIYAREILENDDDLIGQMMARMPAGTIVSLISDHGFENNNYTIRPRVLLRQAGVKGSVEVEDGLIGASDRAAAEYFRKLAGNRKYGIAREVPMAEVRERAPQLKHWVAAFDTMTNYVAVSSDRGPAVGPGTHLGVHGFWPTHNAYRSVFMIGGAGISAGKLGEIDMLEIAPTFAGILGVKLPAARKKSLWPAISQ